MEFEIILDVDMDLFRVRDDDGDSDDFAAIAARCGLC